VLTKMNKTSCQKKKGKTGLAIIQKPPRKVFFFGLYNNQLMEKKITLSMLPLQKKQHQHPRLVSSFFPEKL